MPLPAIDNKDITNVKTITFNKNITVRITYEKDDRTIGESTDEPYQIIYKGSALKDPGKSPNIIIKSSAIGDDTIIPLIGISIDYDNRFPLSEGKVMKFKDIKGNEYCFVRTDAQNKDNEESKVNKSDNSKVNSVIDQANIRKPDSKKTNELIILLDDNKLTVSERSNIILQLMNIGTSDCVPVLLEHLKDKYSLVVRQNAIRALGNIGDKRAIKPLLVIIETPSTGNTSDYEGEGADDAVLKRYSILAIRDIGDVTSIPILQKIVESKKEYKSVQEYAEMALCKLQEKSNTGLPKLK